MAANFNPAPQFSTFVDLLRDRAIRQPDQVAYVFLTDGEAAEVHLTYRQLDQQARAIATTLQRHRVQGDRALLLYPPGLAYIAAFFGCLYAGVVAVPAYPPRRNQNQERLESIATNAEARIILTTEALLPEIQCCRSIASIEHLIATDMLNPHLAADWYPPFIRLETLAFLQYTSGSTGQPKGVKISHHNLLHNSALIHQGFGHSSASKGVIWLPPYHDMGLIGGILQPLYGGFPVVLMSPVAFLQKPLRWLQAISHYQATTSGAPNFAYELCLQKTTAAQRALLDLSHWNIAFTGAEPIRADTLTRFSEAFAESGFRPEAFYPCYGLAESTLWVTGGESAIAPRVLTFGSQAFVSCGRSGDQQVAIVDAETGKTCGDRQVGEIWVAGESVSNGYFNNTEANELSFNAQLENAAGSFFKTGDLGFLDRDELFVTGRIKDLIIIRGQNYYPQDIERTVEQSHAALAQGCGAAFGISHADGEALAIVQEVEREGWRSVNVAEITTAIRSAVSQHHQLQVNAIVLLKPGSIPKTSSGKVKRYACRDAFEQGTLTALGEWRVAATAPQAKVSQRFDRPTDRLVEWLRDYATHHINSRLMDERRSIAPHVVLDFGNQGLLGMQVPAEYGGLGLGHGDTLRILEQLGAIDPTLALFVGLNNVLGIRPILNFGTESLRQELLPLLATGRELAAFALTEPIAGSNPQAIQSQAIAQGNGWLLSGHKIWSGSAAWAGVINVFAQTESTGISGFAVRRGSPGLRQGKEALTMGMRGMVQNAVHLDRVAVTAQDLLGQAGGGMTVAQDAMMYGRLAIAAACVGGMKRCVQLIVRYGSRRTIATGRLLENPVMRFRLGYLNAAIATVNALVRQIAQQLDAGLSVPQEAYTACKTAAPEFYWQAADWLVQALGGRGYIETNLAPQILRDARVLRIFEGPTETLNLFLGSRVLHQRQDLQCWLTQGLNAPDIAAELFAAADQISDRPTPFADMVTGNRWAAGQIGELATWAILWAAARSAGETQAAWAESQFYQKLTQIRTTNDQQSIASVDEIERQIADYEATIGDIEQIQAGEEDQIDDLLCKGKGNPIADYGDGPDRFTSKTAQTQQTSESIQTWLVNWLSQKLKVSANAIDRRQSFADYGIDSVIAVELAQDLETWLNLRQPLDATIAWSFPTLEALANHLAGTPAVAPSPAKSADSAKGDDAIAIIGMDCRFPGASSPEAYWELLSQGVDAIREIPGDRWDVASHYDPSPDAPGKMYVRSGGFIEDVDQFDPQFFGISPREAISMDPQQRLLLEVSHTALERAGQSPQQLQGSATGVFVGISFEDYAKRSLNSNDLTRIDAHSSLGNTRSIAVGRIAYTLGLQGPTMQLDTTCSSSLLAVHLACQSLRSGESNLALAGGVSLILAPEPMVGFCKLKALSPEGRCKTFDANADGYGRGEGCGIVVLKRLGDAIAHQDQILAIIPGTAVNHDGQSNGLTAPNGAAQTAVIRQAVTQAGIEPSQVQYVEAHGTGTALGDPIEVLALNQALGEGRSADQPLLVGAVKTNFGHLEAAAGIAGLIKVVLALQHRQIPPHLHFNQPSPYIPWEQLAVKVPTQLTPWRSFGKRIAGVSSFGMSGTNAHVLLAEAEPPAPSPDEPTTDHLLALSAKSETALRQLVQNYQTFLKSSPALSLSSICFTANTGRSHYEYRLAIVTQSVEKLEQQLDKFLVNRHAEDVFFDRISTSPLPLPEPSPQTLEHLAQLYVQGTPLDWAALTPIAPRIVLPTYPFQRQRYWLDLPVAEVSTHPLLGRSLNLAKLDSHYFYNSSEFPAFLQQHQVMGQPILPAAGYVEMALAAAAKFLSGSLEITNFVIHRPLPLPRSTQLVLIPDADRYCFEIFSLVDQQPILHASGEVSVNQTQPISNLDLSTHQKHCGDEIAIAQFYQTCQDRGIVYGKDFQAIDRLWCSDHQALGHIQLPSHLANSTYQIHPVLLDAAFQVIGAALPDEQTYLPVGFSRLIYHQPLEKTLWSAVKCRSSHPVMVDIDLFNAEGKLCATVESLRLRHPGESKPWAEDWLYRVEWRSQPLAQLPSPIDLSAQVTPAVSVLVQQPEILAYGQLLPQLEQLSFAYLTQAFRALGGLPQQFTTAAIAQQVAAPHQRLLHRLLEILAENGILQQHGEEWHRLDSLPEIEPSTLLQSLQENYPQAIAELTLLDRCGSQLAAVLQGKIDPVQLLFPDGDLQTLTQLYQDSPGAKLMNATVQQVVQAAIQKRGNSPLRVLEIGAGTGGTTAHLLPLFDAATTEYTFTDISPLFTIKAQERFQDYSFVQYQTLDIERSPQSQGYTLESYDIILAANAIHATQDLCQSLTHIHQLLNPGGLLILLEGVEPMVWVDLIFGLTEGWWRFNDFRSRHPLITTEQWRSLLQDCGFEPATITPQLERSAPQSVILGQATRTRNWLILGDRQGLGETLVEQLRRQFQSVTLVAADLPFDAQMIPTTPLNVIYLPGLDVSQHQPEVDAQKLSCHVLELVQSLIARSSTNLYLVTQSSVPEQGAIPSVASSVLGGLTKVIRLEHPALNCRCIGLDTRLPQAEQAQTLLREITTATPESQVSWHQQQRYVPRLMRYQPDPIDHPQRLIISQRGTLENLSFQPALRHPPLDDQVEIRVHATGLNFRDVLNALGVYPGEAGELGCECAGEITAIGGAITQFQPGDQVMAIAPGSFSPFVTVDANWVIHQPESLTAESAATIPVVFLTAFYSLYQLADIQKGDRVLIHSAAGGVGQAAVQLAQQAGAEVFATASPSKWETLRAMGVTHIFNSRDLDFVVQIRSLTQGEGVDIVLNSLSGEFIPASLSLLCPGGQFIELGKGSPPVVPAEIHYTQIDLVELCQQQPQLIQSMLQQVTRQINQQTLHPLPYTRFSIQDVQSAFRTMQQGKHTGKIVITQNSPTRISSQGSYLITGGTGGLGLFVADWLVQQGARHLVLMGRRSPTLSATTQIHSWEQSGIRVKTLLVDVADTSTMQQALSTIAATMPPLQGVIHAAGILDDATLQQLTSEQMTAVLRPKVVGAWNLHTLIQQPLDFFVLFSSATALLGSPGQANHVAANAFLDALAHYRHALGKPALSLNWGVWSDIGAAADRVTQMQRKGIGTIDPSTGIEIFARLLQSNLPQLGVMPMDWTAFLAQGCPDAFLAEFGHTEKPIAVGSAIRLQVQNADPEERRSLLERHLREQIAQVLGWQTTEIDPQKGFFDLGMDSLTSVELKNRLQTSLNCELPTTLIFDYPTLDTLLGYLTCSMNNLENVAEILPEILPETSPLISPEPTDLAALTESELADLLEQELSAIRQGVAQ
jgi:acyl transferase domain-containing protein/acyl-CoA synthetase (AMP-forming)/AMP-acid ligase II/alkylation response protein AidB-like acyl-CoA dehydrogenase/NADPH:quinone reductase-like Zn-dependent oxidoreductase/acyl carrier protein/ubiquinone/menaquinone biosynthesis C-methylase UbiE